MHAATHPSTVTALPAAARPRRSLGRRVTLLLLVAAELLLLLSILRLLRWVLRAELRHTVAARLHARHAAVLLLLRLLLLLLLLSRLWVQDARGAHEQCERINLPR